MGKRKNFSTYKGTKSFQANQTNIKKKQKINIKPGFP